MVYSSSRSTSSLSTLALMNDDDSITRSWLLMIGSAAAGAAFTLGIQAWYWKTTCQSQKSSSSKPSSSSQSETVTTTANKSNDPETSTALGHRLVWQNIAGALNAAMIYTGDRLHLYQSLRELCTQPGSYVTAAALSDHTGLNQRWLEEWLHQQAAMGMLKLKPTDNISIADMDDTLQYRLPAATADVVANPNSKDYDIAMIQMIPALVNRAKTMLPEAFQTGIGQSYNDLDIADAMNRHHKVHMRDEFLPNILPQAVGATLMNKLQQGCKVAELGCGAGVLLLLLAEAYPNTQFHGYDISDVELERAAYHVAQARLSNITLHDAKRPGQRLGDSPQEYDLIFIHDVLHDCTEPADLIAQVKTALKIDGAFMLADITGGNSHRENIVSLPMASTFYAFSTCLCLSCGLSEKGGSGLGTLGFTVPVANRMLTDGGFSHVEVVAVRDVTRWFLVKH